MMGLEGLLMMFGSRWGVSFAGLAIGSALVWYLGPLIPGLQGPLARALLIAGFVLIWAAVNGVLSWRRRRRDRALAAGGASDEGPSREPRRDDGGGSAIAGPSAPVPGIAA
jgi:type VI protein secretion system component VasK